MPKSISCFQTNWLLWTKLDLRNWLVLSLYYLLKESFFHTVFFSQKYNVYHDNSSTDTGTDVIKRYVYFTRPVFTNKFRIVVKESADVISMILKILGQTASDHYSANPNMKPKESFQSKPSIILLHIQAANYTHNSWHYISRTKCLSAEYVFLIKIPLPWREVGVFWCAYCRCWTVHCLSLG